MTRIFRDYLEDILGAIEETEEFTDGMSFDDFRGDRKTTNAVIRSLEVLGEASKKIPENLRSLAPTVPWKAMSGMSDKLIHEYFGVDLQMVWTVINEELPPLREPIAALLKREELSHDEFD